MSHVVGNLWILGTIIRTKYGIYITIIIITIAITVIIKSDPTNMNQSLYRPLVRLPLLVGLKRPLQAVL